jgi:hypothetical protein
MSRTSPTPYPVLQETAKQELKKILLESNPDCVVGIGIRIFLENPGRTDELILELQRLVSVSREYMTDVIGKKAIQLLFPMD